VSDIDAYGQARITGAQAWLAQWSKPRDEALVSPLAAWQAACRPEPSASTLAAALAAPEPQPEPAPAPKVKPKGAWP
jgi:hypothetical protein